MHEDMIGTSASAIADANLLCMTASSLVAALPETFYQAVQRPDIVRMLGTPLNPAAQAQIVATDLLGLDVMALLSQQGRQRMPRRMHPGPRLDVLQIVVAIDRLPQMGIAKLMIASVVFEFAIQHLLADREDAAGAIVEDLSLRGDAPQAVAKYLAFPVGRAELLQRRLCNALGVVGHRGRNRIQLPVIRQRRADDVLPAPETHHHMLAHRIIAFEAGDESRAALDAENLLGDQAAQFARRGDRVLISAHEHAGMHHQQQIVCTCRRVGGERTGVVEIAVVGSDRLPAGDPCLFVFAAQHMDMRGHMVQVAGVRAHRRKGVRRGHRPFRLIRGFKDMDMQMYDRRMVLHSRPLGEADRALAHLERLYHVGALRWQAVPDIPQPSWRSNDQGFDKERRHVVIVSMLMMDPAQFRGVVVVPLVKLFRLDGMRLLDAAALRLHQPILERRRPVRQGARLLDMFAGPPRREIGLFLAMVAPCHVVVRPAAIGDAPMRHDAFRIVFERLCKTFDALRSVEGKTPVQTQVEPALGFRRGCRDRSGVAAKVETIHLSNSSIAQGQLSRTPRNRTADAYHLHWQSGDDFSLCLDN
jgi:hypothetical protein